MTTTENVGIKAASMFYPSELLDRLRDNIASEAWAAQLAANIQQRAQPWLEMSDEQLWSLMFGAKIPRSWMVWSDGHCPACENGVPMYNWKIDALAQPWKVQCPHCGQRFPTNDFHAFYRSGLDAAGVFDPEQADRSLLFNVAHPDPNDPRHSFGVDDGQGYVQGNHRWRFIGAYLIYGQWKQAVLGGIKALAEAYVVTGEPVYARKAGIMLDRVADLYPSFDFATQGYNYERQGTNGYLSNWHDACEETRELALAYDMVFAGMRSDPGLPVFLARQAQRYGLENPKQSFPDIQRNIENGILRNALANSHKIHSNYPRQDIAKIIIKTVLNQPRESVYPLLDAMIARATAVDGVTGEKGLANYSAFVIQSLANFLAQWNRAEPGFLQRCLGAHPALHQTYRFHIDTWCLQKYYPLVGDTGWFARSIDQYQGVRFQRPDRDFQYTHQDTALSPSMFTFLWDLHRTTGDPAFVQVLHHANDGAVEGLPHDLFAYDAEAMRQGVAGVIAEHGAAPEPGNVNKKQWGLAILRSGAGDSGRAVWLNYEAGGGHGHMDGLNLGLFAHGLDLMPELGYPPVQYGGWGAPRAAWYKMSAAHNTVVVEGQDHAPSRGQTTLWAEGAQCRAVRASVNGALPLLAAIQARQPLTEDWKFMWDPDKQGQNLGWQSTDHNDDSWHSIEPDVAWQHQPVGQQWQANHGEPYNGVAWYRGRFEIGEPTVSNKIEVVFGAVDAAGTIWVNGKELLDRPYPYQGDGDSWNRSFAVDITEVVRYDRPNTVAVRVDNVAGEGGIKRGVWLAIGGQDINPQFERTVVQVDMPVPDQFYILDIFRVAGGRDHTLFMHSHFGEALPTGLTLAPGADYGHNTQMRNFRWDDNPRPGWHVDWRIEDRFGLLPPGKEVNLRYTSLTSDAQAALAEAWISFGGYGGDMRNEAWIPRLAVRRQTDDGALASTFVGVIEPYTDVPSIHNIRRLPLNGADGRHLPDSAVAVEIAHADGGRDLLLAADVGGAQGDASASPPTLVQTDWNVTMRGELALIRQSPDRRLIYLFAAKTEFVRIGDQQFDNDDLELPLQWAAR